MCAVADRDVFDQNLGESPCLQRNGGTIPITTRFGWKNVPRAYNSMINAVDCHYRIFVHEDVYLPKGFMPQIAKGIESVEKGNKHWDVIGVAGTVWVEQGPYLVKMYAGNYLDKGKPSSHEVELPAQVETIDEIVIVTRTNKKFDDENPYHHLMGADMCWRSRGVYVVDAYCEHSCKGDRNLLPIEFAISAGYMYRKHHDRLPLSTNCATIQEVDGVCSIVA